MEFRLFGPMEVLDGGRTVDLGTPKQRAVLAMLALEPGRVVSLDRLIDELWAGEAPSSATGTLQAYISNLRRALEPDRAPRTPPTVLVTREPGYLLAVAPGSVDVVRFATWAQEGGRALAHGEPRGALRLLDDAIVLWRGDPLAEFAEQAFAVPTVAKLAELRVTAEEDRAEARLALGEPAVADLERLVETHTYRERSWALLVRALYRSGRQADALAALRRARDLLAGELGLDPGPELQLLERAVLDQDPDLAPKTPAASAQVSPQEVHSGQELIGRDRELGRIGARLSEVRQGRGGVVLVEGEAGIGKTQLVQAAADEAAARGMAVAWGRCVDTATAPAFWPWAQALREIGPGAEEVVRLLTGDSPACPDIEVFEVYQRVMAAMTGSGPLVVVLEDLHWADVASLRLLGFVGGELARQPVLVVATVRPEPGEHPEQLRDTLGTLARAQGERLTVAPFTGDDVSAFLRMRRSDPALAGALHERSGGNPFYLGELLRLLESEGSLSSAVPAGVRDVVGRRVARLPEQSQSLLRIAAVAGMTVDLDLLHAVSGAPVEEVMSHLDAAVATGMLAEDGEDYAFAHALVRDTLYAGLGRAELARMHLRVGEALEGLPGGTPSDRAADLAHHFDRASRIGGRAKVVTYASIAARTATARFAYDEAVRLWEMALAAADADDVSARCGVLTELGRARRAVGDSAGAHRDLSLAIELARQAGDRESLIEAVSFFGGQSVWIWRPYGEVDEPMVGVLEDLLADPLDDRHRAALLGTLGLELVYGPRRAEGERRAAEGVELARRLGDPVLTATTLNNYYLAAWAPGREAERRAATEEMLALPVLPRVTELVARVLRMTCLMRAGELAEWDRDLARCHRLLEELDRPELASMVDIVENAGRVLRGDWATAEERVERATALRYGNSLWGPDFPRLVTLFTCRRGQGRLGELLAELVAAAANPLMIPLRPLAVLAALECDDPALATELVERWGTDVRDDWVADFLFAVWGQVSARLGVPDPRTAYDRLLPYADQLVVSGMICGWGSHHVVLAELAQRLGDKATAAEHARQAVEIHRRLGMSYWEHQSLKLLDSLT